MEDETMIDIAQRTPEIPEPGAHPEDGEGDEQEPDGTDGTDGGGV